MHNSLQVRNHKAINMPMVKFDRYALYYLPKENTPLHHFGDKWLGWSLTETNNTSLTRNDATEDWVRAPRKYGFHGTLKPPFKLSSENEFPKLFNAVNDLCRTIPPFMRPALTLKNIGGFMAFTLSKPSNAMTSLACCLVSELDSFRAPPTTDELARRRSVGLTERQEGYLMQWGYPYVMDEFIFHLTLTSRLDDIQAQQASSQIAVACSHACYHAGWVSAIGLVGEGGDGQSRLIARIPLSG